MDCSRTGFPDLHYLLEFAQTHVHWVRDESNHLILCCPLLLPSIFPNISLFQRVGLPIRWPKYWSFNISPSSEYSGLISSRIDWFDLLTVQGILKSLLQHHNAKASTFWLSAFFSLNISHGDPTELSQAEGQSLCQGSPPPPPHGSKKGLPARHAGLFPHTPGTASSFQSATPSSADVFRQFLVST